MTSKREAAAVEMVLAGATRRAACEEHAVYPANLRRALRALGVWRVKMLQRKRFGRAP